MLSAEVMLYYLSSADNYYKQWYGIVEKWTAEPDRPFLAVMPCLSGTKMNEK